MEVVFAVALGIALSACCGLRAFLPLLVTGLLARFGHFSIHEKVDWLSSTPALIAVGVATVLEIGGDKFPALDHALDVVQTPTRLASGVLVAMAAFHQFPTWAAALLAIVAGSATAAGVHATKATVRAGSSATTAGIANPIISLIEDIVCAVGSILAPLLVVIALIMAVVALILLFFVVRTIARKIKARRAAAAQPAS